MYWYRVYLKTIIKKKEIYIYIYIFQRLTAHAAHPGGKVWARSWCFWRVWLLLIFEDSWVHMGSSCGIVLLKVWHFPESDDPFNYSHHSGARAAAGFFLRSEVRTPTPGTGAVYLAVLSHIHYRAYLQNETRIPMGRSWS